MVLVVQEIFGVHEHIKDICRRLAKLGYFAVAPELYARQGDVSKLDGLPGDHLKIVSKVPDAQVMSDLDATVAWAKATGKADTAKLGITGFCWGGRIVWLYCGAQPERQGGRRLVRPARRARPTSCIPSTRSTWPRRSTAPILGLYGGADRASRSDTVEKMRDGPEGRGQDRRDRRLSRHAPRLLRRLSPQLPQGAGRGRLEADARVVQEERRRLIDRSRRIHRGPAVDGRSRHGRPGWGSVLASFCHGAIGPFEGGPTPSG